MIFFLIPGSAEFNDLESCEEGVSSSLDIGVWLLIVCRLGLLFENSSSISLSFSEVDILGVPVREDDEESCLLRREVFDNIARSRVHLLGSEIHVWSVQQLIKFGRDIVIDYDWLSFVCVVRVPLVSSCKVDSLVIKGWLCPIGFSWICSSEDPIVSAFFCWVYPHNPVTGNESKGQWIYTLLFPLEDCESVVVCSLFYEVSRPWVEERIEVVAFWIGVTFYSIISQVDKILSTSSRYNYVGVDSC